MKIWNTKYCLTSGITQHTAEQVDQDQNTVTIGVYLSTTYLHGRDWHKTEAAAIERAEEVKIKKLQSLDKQIKKISGLEF